MGQTALLIGATGMVGSQVLDLLLRSPAVDKVITISRRTTGVRHDKLRDIAHADFRDFAALKADLTGIDVCFYCVGVYQGHVSKEAFFEITCDYQKALTDVLSQTSPQATFVLFGASGADPGEKSRATFAQAKGRAETLLHAAGFPKTYIFRPGYIHPTGARSPSGLVYKLAKPVFAFMRRRNPDAVLTDRALARAMVSVGLTTTRASGVIDNRAIKEIAGGAVQT